MKKQKHSIISTVYRKYKKYIQLGTMFFVVCISVYIATPKIEEISLGHSYHVRHDITLHLPLGDMYVQVADRDSEREMGLSYRKEIAQDEGMLFVFLDEGKYSFWMKDMNFPIDIVWLNKEGYVIHIEENANPASYRKALPKIFTSEGKAMYVLEASAFSMKKYGVFIGTKVRLDTPSK